uniref:Uncharacterized protein n=1 Tax=Solanum lycopersicum TaxID=4081 RepID=A0A3Q7GFS0_SOLLC
MIFQISYAAPFIFLSPLSSSPSPDAKSGHAPPSPPLSSPNGKVVLPPSPPSAVGPQQLEVALPPSPPGHAASSVGQRLPSL